jgi:hypothetical protein
MGRSPCHHHLVHLANSTLVPVLGLTTSGYLLDPGSLCNYPALSYKGTRQPLKATGGHRQSTSLDKFNSALNNAIHTATQLSGRWVLRFGRLNHLKILVSI